MSSLSGNRGNPIQTYRNQKECQFSTSLCCFEVIMAISWQPLKVFHRLVNPQLTRERRRGPHAKIEQSNLVMETDWSSEKLMELVPVLFLALSIPMKIPMNYIYIYLIKNISYISTIYYYYMSSSITIIIIIIITIITIITSITIITIITIIKYKYSILYIKYYMLN